MSIVLLLVGSVKYRKMTLLSCQLKCIVVVSGSFLPGDLVGTVKPLKHWKMPLLSCLLKYQVVLGDSFFSGQLKCVMYPLKMRDVTAYSLNYTLSVSFYQSLTRQMIPLATDSSSLQRVSIL